MAQHLQRETDRLKRKILALSTYVEESVQRAVKSLSTRDEKAAQRVIDDDEKIDEMEVDVEEDCLKILALHQPVAIDLRFIVAVLKINNDLERIGDLAVNIAERSLYLASQPPLDAPYDFPKMATTVQGMLHQALDALVNLDADLAKTVLTEDEEVDTINRKMYEIVQQRIQYSPDQSHLLIQMLSVSRNLERIADHTTNIAEDVLYMITGEIMRHGARQY